MRNLFNKHKGGETIRKQAITYKYLIPLLLITLTLLFCASTVSAADEAIFVNVSHGNDSWDGQTWQTAKLTIQNATGTVSPNGVVTIANGTYSGTGNTNITINRNMTIQGLSQEGTIINGTDTNWIFNIYPGLSVTIYNLTLTNGYSPGRGGAIYNEANLTLTNCTFNQNQALYGGSIYNLGTLTVNGSTFTNNKAVLGGAILNTYGDTRSLTCTITESTFNQNQATDGGAIHNFNSNTGSFIFTVTKSTFNQNQASIGGAIYNVKFYSGYFESTVTESTFNQNQASNLGGAIFNDNAYTGIMSSTVIFNRFYNNTAPKGSAIYSSDSMNLENNWWGVNNPNSDWTKFLGKVNSPTKWVQLTINATPDVLCVGETSTVTANLNYNNLGEDLMAKYGKSIPSAYVQFTVDNLGTLNPYNGNITNGGNTTTTFNAGQMPGNSSVNLTVDNTKLTKTITIQREDVYVATAANGGSDSNNGSSTNPFLTLAKAITEVKANGRIHIANGEYTGTSNRGLNIPNNMTILRDTWIPGVGDSVIINAENKDCIIHNGYTLILQNLVLVNGNNSGDWGYGGAIQNWNNLTVENCTFTGNIANYGGAIANLFWGDVRLNYNGTYSNSWELSTAITSTITGCTFTGNTATFDGGAISNYIYSSSTVNAYNGANITAALKAAITSNITNCTFTNNAAYDGGAISNNCTVYGTAISENGNATAISEGNIKTTITGCTLANNNATDGGAISDRSFTYLKAIAIKANTSVVGYNLINNTITGNTIVNNTARNGGAISDKWYLTITESYDESPRPVIDYNTNINSQVHFNRIVANTATDGSAIYSQSYSAVNAAYNWWGSNDDPSSQMFGNVDYSPWLYMTINATPDTINNTQTSLVTASFNNYSSDGTSFSPLDPNLGHIPDGAPVTFSFVWNPLGTLTEPLTVMTSNGTSSILFTANTIGVQQIKATTDNQNVSTYITINPSSFVDINKEFRDLPWGSVITTAYYNDKIYAIVEVRNLGPDSTESVNVQDLLNGLTWTGNYYVLRTVGSYPSNNKTWVPNDSQYPFNGTDWNVGSLTTTIGSERWLAIEVSVNRTGTVSNYAETVNQSSYPYQGYANYTAYLTTTNTPTFLTANNVSGNKGDTVTLKAVLTDYLGNPLAGKTVKFWIDNIEVGQNTTDNTGTALFNYIISQSPGNHTLNATFNETNYQESNATGSLYVPTANLYLEITSDKNNPTVGETFTLTYKLGNKGPDTADNVTVIIPVPEGFHILQIYGDGNWTVNTNGTITWTFNNVTVGDPYLHLYGYASGEGDLPFTASIFSDTYNLNTIGVNSLTIHTIPQTTPEANAATTQTTSRNTVGMQSTGAPIVPLALAVLSVLGGLAATRKKQ